MKPRSLLLFAVLSSAMSFGGAAVAQTTAFELQAQQAQVALSERYATLYASLPIDERRQFASVERRWLNGGRWDEQRHCLLSREERQGVLDAPDAAALCLAEVIEARVRLLAPARVAVVR